MLKRLIVKNYVENSALKCMFIFPEDIDHIVYHCPHLVFDEEKIYSLDIDDLPTFFYKNIKHVSISLCSRLMSIGEIDANPLSIFQGNNKTLYSEEPILYAGKMGVSLTYCLDLEFMYDNISYHFESFSILNAKKIIDLFKYNNVYIDDPIGIDNILNKYDTKELLYKYFQLHYNDLSQRYHLDNPRGQIVLSR